MLRKQANDPLYETFTSTIEHEVFTGATGVDILRNPKDGTPYVSQKDIIRYTIEDLEFWEEYIMDTPEWEAAMEALDEVYDTSMAEVSPSVMRPYKKSVKVNSILEQEYDMEVEDEVAEKLLNVSLVDRHNNASDDQVDKMKELLSKVDRAYLLQALALAEVLEDKRLNDVIRDFLSSKSTRSKWRLNEGVVWMTVEITVHWGISTRGRIYAWPEDSEEESEEDSDWY